jgi:putative ABC transport system permease protein
VRHLSSLAWRSLLARRVRTFLTITGIALGVAVLFASLATNAAVEDSVGRTVDTLLGNAAIRVSAFGSGGLSEATRQAIAATEGVTLAVPQIERRTYLLAGASAGTSGLRPPVTVLGIDPVNDQKVRPAVLAAGSPLSAGTRRALISESLAAQDGLRVGSTIQILGAASPADSTFTVSGLLPGAGPLPTSGDRIVEIAIDDATTVFVLGGVTRVDLLLAPGTSPAVAAARLDAQIRSQQYVLATPADVAASLRASTSDVQATMALIAAISLFVGAILIFNTLSMSVAERAREVALLRAAGATRRQVHGLVLVQASLVGLTGSFGGVGAGWLLASWLAGHVAEPAGTLGAVPLGEIRPVVAVIAVAVIVGIAVTIAAAIEPAWRAGRISPIEALNRRPDVSGRLVARLRWLLAVFVVVAIAGLILWPRGAAVSGLVGSFAVYGLLLVVTLLSPIVLPALSRIVGLPFAALLRVEERLARGTLIRDRSRTALTVGSLTMGLAMIIALAAVGQSDRRAATAWLADVVPGDELVTSIRPVPASEDVQPTLAAVPGVSTVSPIARFDLAYNGTRLDAAAVSGHDLLVDGRLSFSAGDRDSALRGFDEGGTVVLPRAQADRLKVRLGDVMAFAAPDGHAVNMRVAGIVERSLPGRAREAVLVAWSDATNRFGVPGADAYAIRFVAGQADAARPALDRAAMEMALQPATIASLQGAAGVTLDRVFGLFDMLAAIAVIVAGLGIVNTLTMNVIERVREVGVLRALGMTRRQVWRMVVVEASVLGMMGVILGGLTGVLVAGVMVGLAGGLPAIGAVQVPWAAIGLASGYGVAVAILAAVYPARRAAGMSIVRAVSFE